MDYIFKGFHFQDKSADGKSKFYVLGPDSKKDILELETEIARVADFVTLEDQLNKGTTWKFETAPLYNKDKKMVGCVVYISKALLRKMMVQCS
jgi:hypothetical protein